MKPNAECGIRNAELRDGKSRRRFRALPFRIPQSEFRNGVTLIELLIAITIIATLSVLFLGASRAATESARAARTKTTIAKLHTLILEHWASYETRRVDLRRDLQSEIDSMLEGNLTQQQLKAAVASDVRLLALRELVKFEMPDRWSDFVFIDDPISTSEWLTQSFLDSTPTICKIYFRRFAQAVEATKELSTEEQKDKIADNQAAECLYLTVMMLTGDGEARTMFTAQDIGDVDEDGAPEFLDGWGNPIAWSRWPAGFALNGRSALMSGDTAADHDPFDPFRRNLTTAVPNENSPATISQVYSNQPPDPYDLSVLRPFIVHLRDFGPNDGFLPGYRLVPLIYSAGPDGEWDMYAAKEVIVTDDPAWLDPYATDPAGTSSKSFPPNYPAYLFARPWDVNEDGDDNSIDNVHNHLQDNR
jgi:prepilin-type N-terminal cleavage/methylation domain-containing protein